MEKPSLTIIIPAYNVGDSLAKCVESVISQDFLQWQAIIIDDGSTDNTLDVANNLAEKDTRITVSHKDNGGLSDARNHGLDLLFGIISCGDSSIFPNTPYVTFIDSDDYISPSTLGPLMHELNIHPEYDLLEYSATLYSGSKRETLLTLPDTIYISPKDYWLRGRGYCHSYSWNKIYRNTIFSSGLRFPKGKIFEDVWMLPHILKACKTVVTTTKGRYVYMDNPKGITHSANHSASLLAQLLHAQIEAMRLLEIDISAPSLSKDEARLYLSLRNQQTTIKRLDPNHPAFLPIRRIPFSAATTIREIIKVLYYRCIDLFLTKTK